MRAEGGWSLARTLRGMGAARYGLAALLLLVACSSHSMTRRTLFMYGTQGHFAHLLGERKEKPWVDSFYPEQYAGLCVEPIFEKHATFRQLLPPFSSGLLPPGLLVFPGLGLHSDLHRTPAICITGPQRARLNLRQDRGLKCRP